MAKYKVIKYFTDLQDSSFAYHEGDIFPREGLEVSEERIKELSTEANRRKQPLIEAIEEPHEDIPEEIEEELKEEPQEAKADESPSKSTKAKKNGKKS